MLISPRTMVRLGISCGVIGAMGSLPAAGQAPNRPAQTIFGVYGQPQSGRDSVRITEKANGQIGVNLKLYYANGHTCQLNQDGQWVEDHVAVVADGIDATRPCRLNFFFEKGRVLLKDDGFQCASVYCGTRGKLDNVSLQKFNPKRK
jgi:hypothetical protein